jgi:hypothetical protein
MNALKTPNTLGFACCQMLAIAVLAVTLRPQQLRLVKKKCYREIKTMKDKSLGLILFALRELQSNIQYAPDQILRCLRDDFGVNIATIDRLYEEINELAETLNCGGENV